VLGPGERSFEVAEGRPGVAAAIAGSRDGRHMQENVGAAGLDLSGVLPEIEQLIPLGPTFTPAEQSS